VGTADAATVFQDSFEGTQIGSNWNVYETFGTWVTTHGAGIEVQRSGTVVNAADGNQYIELDSDEQVTPRDPIHGSNSAMATLIDLVAGQVYEVSFAYRPRTNNTNDNGVAVSIGQLAGDVFTETQALGSADARRSVQNAWQTVRFVFTAMQGDNALQFAAFGTENELGGFIDAVEVSSVPVPAAALLFATGAGFFARRRRT
ncbi:MAG: PEP-CTERM sorting domain-containing protein, partial [Parvularcula sp.]|nr:PEP-CTERM sorting domain-containing protein [Parvularcula sp.]